MAMWFMLLTLAIGIMILDAGKVDNLTLIILIKVNNRG